VKPDLAGRRVSENNTQLFSWDWPQVDESILPIVPSMVDTNILRISNAAIARLRYPARKSGSCGAAGRSVMEMVVHMPVI